MPYSKLGQDRIAYATRQCPSTHSTTCNAGNWSPCRTPVRIRYALWATCYYPCSSTRPLRRQPLPFARNWPHLVLSGRPVRAGNLRRQATIGISRPTLTTKRRRAPCTLRWSLDDKSVHREGASPRFELHDRRPYRRSPMLSSCKCPVGRGRDHRACIWACWTEGYFDTKRRCTHPEEPAHQNPCRENFVKRRTASKRDGHRNGICHCLGNLAYERLDW